MLLNPWFSFITMFLSNKIFFSVLFIFNMLFRFFFNLFFIRSIILIIVFIMFITTFSFSIRNRNAIRIISRFRGFYNIFMFLFFFLDGALGLVR